MKENKKKKKFMKENKEEKKFILKPNLKKLQKAYKKANSPEVVNILQKKYKQQQQDFDQQKANSLYKTKKSKNKLIKSAIKTLLKKKLLKKPTINLPSYSPKRFVSQTITEDRLVREVPKVILIQDNRSLFFRESYESQKRKRFGGFI